MDEVVVVVFSWGTDAWSSIGRRVMDDEDGGNLRGS
jgi:hypothetical protein